eukprot:1737190-Amphidinium_carterae.2
MLRAQTLANTATVERVEERSNLGAGTIRSTTALPGQDTECLTGWCCLEVGGLVPRCLRIGGLV